MKNSFSLIELLVVIAILAVLSTAVIIALNPFEFAKQARDGRRLSELQVINTSLGVYQTGGGIYLGSSNTVYVSVPSATSTCSDLGLPSLPSGWAYHCAPSSTLTKVDGTGWISVDFTSGSYGPGLEKLPIDPINTTSSRNYYTYTPGGSWELAASLESAKYKMAGAGDKVSKDGGSYLDLYEVGNNLTLLPVDYGDSSLVGYWKLNETGGLYVYDSSGSNNNGTSSASGITYGQPGKAGTAFSFDGSNGYVDCGTNSSVSPNSSITYAGWFKTSDTGDHFKVIIGGDGWLWNLKRDIFVDWGYSGLFFDLYINSGIQRIATVGVADGSWHFFAGTYNGSVMKLYLDSVLQPGSINVSGSISAPGASFRIGGSWSDRFNGLIDEVRVYNRALSAAEISIIYNSTK